MQKIKIGLAALLLAGGFTASAQTNSPSPFRLALASLGTVSNYDAIPYGTYFNNNSKIGGGLFVLYKWNDLGGAKGLGAGAGMGMDWAGEWRLFDGTVDVNYKYALTPKLDAMIYGLVAAGSSVSGAETANGGLATGEGGGGEINYQFNDKFNAGLGVGYVMRQGCGEYSGGSEMLTLKLHYQF